MATSSSAETASEPTTHAPSTLPPSWFQSRSVARVVRMPLTRTRSSARIRYPSDESRAGLSRRAAGSAAAAAEAQLRHEPGRLHRDPRRHLALPAKPLGEDDRDFDDAEARLHRPVGQLDLERVALRLDARKVDRLEHLAAEALEPAGEVVLAQAEDTLGVVTAGAAHDAAGERPVDDAAAPDVARAEHEVGASGGAEDAREIARVV